MAGGWGGPSPEGRGYRRVRGLPRDSSGGDGRGGGGGGERAGGRHQTRSPPAKCLKMCGRGRAGGPGEGEGAPRLPSHPLRINGPPGGGGRAGGRRQPVDERGPPGPGPVPRRAQRSLPAGPPWAPPHVNGRIPRGSGAGGSALSSLPRGPPDGRAAAAGGQGAGAGWREGGRGSPGPAGAGSPPRSRLSPGSGRLVAAIGTQGGPPGLLSPSLPLRRAALEHFLPLRPPRCPPDMVGHLQLQGMDESLKEKSREGLLDSPDSGLPPSPSPPFYSLSPGEGRAGGSGGADPPATGHRREAKDGKVVRAKPWALGSDLSGPRGEKVWLSPGVGGSEERACAH